MKLFVLESWTNALEGVFKGMEINREIMSAGIRVGIQTDYPYGAKEYELFP